MNFVVSPSSYKSPFAMMWSPSYESSTLPHPFLFENGWVSPTFFFFFFSSLSFLKIWPPFNALSFSPGVTFVRSVIFCVDVTFWMRPSWHKYILSWCYLRYISCITRLTFPISLVLMWLFGCDLLLVTFWMWLRPYQSCIWPGSDQSCFVLMWPFGLYLPDTSCFVLMWHSLDHLCDLR